MNLKEDIVSVSDVKVGLKGILGSVEENRRPIVITQSGQAKAVLMDIASYEQQKNLLYLLKILAQGEGDIEAGGGIPQEEVFANLHRSLISAK